MKRYEELQAAANAAYEAVNQAAEVMAEARAIYAAAVQAEVAANVAYDNYEATETANKLRMYRGRTCQSEDECEADEAERDADARAEAAYEEYIFRNED